MWKTTKCTKLKSISRWLRFYSLIATARLVRTTLFVNTPIKKCLYI